MGPEKRDFLDRWKEFALSSLAARVALKTYADLEKDRAVREELLAFLDDTKAAVSLTMAAQLHAHEGRPPTRPGEIRDAPA